MNRHGTRSMIRRRGLVVGLLGVLVVTAAGLAVQQTALTSPLTTPARTRPAAPSSAPPRRCLVVGAYVSPQEPAEGSPVAAFRQAQAVLGPLTVRRSFDRSLPEDFAHSAAAPDPAAGIRSFVSWKPPHGDVRGTIAGRYDGAVATWARSVPAGSYATAYHEPENDMSAGEFVALQRHLYAVVKAANPSIHWGPVYMAYWWDPGQPRHFLGDPAAWWPGAAYADFAGLDWYGPQPAPMTASASFTLWYQTMEPTGLPLYIVEYGQYELTPGETSDPALEQMRATAIRDDAAWIQKHPRIELWMYWDAIGSANGDWRLRDETSQRAWRAVAAAGCPRG